VSAHRAKSEARGRRAEVLSAWWLRALGHRVLARRWRCPAGEIDLIARRGGVLAFVEVKARPSVSTALEAVSPHQRHRIERAAEAFLSQQPKWRNLDVRFDVMVVAPGRPPRHVRDAWRPGA